MNLMVLTAIIAVSSAAKLDRTYLPPPSAKTAGGSPGAIQAPLATNNLNQGVGSFPKGSFTNEFQGVVVDAAAAGTRASGEGETGLGAPRISYGSTNSKVGDAAFRGSPTSFQFPGNSPFESAADGQTAGTNESPQNFLGPQRGQGFQGPQKSQSPQRFQGTQGFPTQQGLQEPQSLQGPQGFQGSQTLQGFQRPQGLGPQGFEEKYVRSQALVDRDRTASTLRFDSNIGTDSYSYSFETDNGISAEENGVATNGVQAQGGYSYTGDDGQVYSVTYTADEGGYQPRGEHLPTPPPIPVEILRSLEQNAREAAAGQTDDGSYDAQKYNAGGDYTENDNTNAQFNGGQPSQFGKRPESDATSSGTFINQNNQPFVRPNNAAGQTGQATAGQVSAPESNTFGSSNVNKFDQANKPLNAFHQGSSANRFTQANQPTVSGFQQNGRPIQNAGPQDSSGANTFVSQNFAVNSQNPNDIQNNVQGQINSQSSASFGRPNSNIPSLNQLGNGNRRPVNSNPFGPSSSNGNSIGQLEQSSQPNSFLGAKNEYLPPVGGFTQNKRPTISQQTSTNTFSQSPAINQFSQSPSQFGQEKPLTTSADSSSPISSFAPNLGSNVLQSENSLQSSGSPIKSQQSTAQPQTELTTPLEARPNSQQNTIQKPSGTELFNSQSIQNQPTQPPFGKQPDSNDVSQSPSPTSSSASAFASFSNSQIASSKPFGSTFGQPLQQQYTQQNNVFRQPQNKNEFSQSQSSGVQFAPSTQRPIFSQSTQQAQGPDDSYYYNQPSRPFSTPTSQVQASRFPSSSFNQFNRVTQRPSFPSQSSNSQQNIPTRYPSSSAFPTAAPTLSTQGSTFPSFGGITQASASSFTSGIPTASTQSGSQFVSNFNRRPTQGPSSQFNNQLSAQSFGQNQQQSFVSNTFSEVNKNQVSQQDSTQNQSPQIPNQRPLNQVDSSKDDSSPPVPSQQYDGEIYEYNKPADPLPPPDQKETKFSQSPKTDVTTGAQSVSSQSSNSQFGSQFSRPQNAQNTQTQPNRFNAQRPTSSSIPQFGIQTATNMQSTDDIKFAQESDAEEIQPDPVQGSRPQPSQFRPFDKSQSTQVSQFSQDSKNQQYKPQFSSCCKNIQPTQSSSQFGGKQQNQGQFNTQGSGFSAQGFKPDQSSAQSFAGKGEVFGGPRKPPSFDDQTGYHY